MIIFGKKKICAICGAVVGSIHARLTGKIYICEECCSRAKLFPANFDKIDGMKLLTAEDVKRRIAANEEKVKPLVSATRSGDKALSQREQGYYDHRQKEIDALTARYDFTTVDGINSIPVPAPEINQGSTTGQIDYYLRFKAGEYKRLGQMDIAIACLRKANELMPHSPIAWQGKDYLRLVQYLKADKQFEEARRTEGELKLRFPELFDDGTILSKKRLQSVLRDAKKLKTDLIEMSFHKSTCGECAKYQGRVYSISGQDMRYPKLPDTFIKFGGVHPGCRHTFFVYFDGSPTTTGKNAITFSNRPFEDDRTADEIKAYDNILAERQQAHERENDRAVYDVLCEKLPDIAPKSFNGYRRMKAANSPAYAKLIEAARSVGIDI